MSNRPKIPAEIEEEILIECGHRCAVCGTQTPLERAHIIPWCKSKEHKAENLICLCANCHERADKEGWGEQTLREYKQKPWVMRQYENAEIILTPTKKVTLTIGIELEDFDDGAQRWALSAIAAFVDVSPYSVRKVWVEKSSVRFTIELPAQSAEYLLNAYKANDPELSKYLAPLVLLDLRPGEVEPKQTHTRVTLTFEIKLRSEYHVSTGSGLGARLDSALLRDGDGIPVLRGTIMAGLLRDGLWRLLQLKPLEDYQACQRSGKVGTQPYCGHSDNGAVMCPLCTLFGTPRLLKHWQISSARPVGLETPTTPNGWQPGRTGGQIVHRARVSPRTRRAEARKLFSQEHGDSRLCFRFTAICSGDGEATLDEAALFMAAARNVRELGRSRRRGQGECRIHLVESSALPGLISVENQSLEEALLTRFEQRWLSHKAEGQKISEPSFPMVSVTSAKTSHAVRLRLVVRADEPITIARRGEAGNQFETLKIIPSAALRGVFATRVTERHDLNDAMVYADFVKLFLRGQVHFPFLYPARCDGDDLYPAIPAPRDFLTCKVFPGLKKYQHGAQGFAVQPLDVNKHCQKCQAAGKETLLQSLSGFVTVEEGPQLLEVCERSEMHIRINPERQRVEQGDLFGYTALETGQYFVGEISFSDEVAWQRFQQLTGLPVPGQTFELRLGKATRRGYGHVTARLERCESKEPIWVRVPVEERVLNPALLTLTLLTDAIIADAWGRYRLGFEADWLSKELGVQVDPASLNVFAGTRLVDAFNVYLGLPRWRDVAINAGSSVGFRLINPPDDWRERLNAVEQNGLGLRREEGFGRVVFNHPVYHRCQGITSSDITLGEGLRLAAKVTTSEHVLSKEAQFGADWKRTLDDESRWNECKDEQFAAVARWLHTNRDQPLATLCEKLKTLGEPDASLRTIIPDYGNRSKPNKINPAVDLIVSMLNKLAEKSPTKSEQALGVAMLAERIAAAIEQAKKEEQ